VAGVTAFAAGLLGSGQSEAEAAETAVFIENGKKHQVSDTDILNFALNLEYLEAEFYLRATSNTGLGDSAISGVTGSGKKPKTPATPGAVTGGTQVPFLIPAIQAYAAKNAADEAAHVTLLRTALGKDAVARPAIDLQASFNAAASAAGIGSTFDPFANDDNFLLGAFIFEDVGVTAYHGAAPFIKKSALLNAAAGILGIEAYHAGSIRTTLYARGQSNPALITAANKITVLRASADGSGGAGNEAPLVADNGTVNISVGDANAVAFARTFQEVLNIVYLGPTKGGFFPDGLNGMIA